MIVGDLAQKVLLEVHTAGLSMPMREQHSRELIDFFAGMDRAINPLAGRASQVLASHVSTLKPKGPGEVHATFGHRSARRKGRSGRMACR